MSHVRRTEYRSLLAGVGRHGAAMSHHQRRTTRLVRVAKANKELIDHWKEGVSLTNDLGVGIDDLRTRVTAARFRLAVEFRRQANLILKTAPHLARSAISRYYYCLYHALRSAAYIHHGGDDHEAHAELPQKLPNDIPDVGNWKNTLKSAREIRNRADYDPYPVGALAWNAEAERLRREAGHLVGVVRSYLKTKGVNV